MDTVNSITNDSITYGYYEFENNILFLKVIKLIEGKTEQETEDFLAARISEIEGKQFSIISYLNI